MKIKKLTIQNIASIENAEIEFDNGPLSVDPLFLITGDTGTGKTTILNAICLALYDKVPALDTIGTADKDGEGLQTDNPRQLMRKGTGYSCVELTFVGNDDKQYLAKWETQRARGKVTGRIQSTKRQLQELGSTNIYIGKTEVEPVIKRIVGLTFEQFTRTTMLAQGQFSTFMKAADKDKSDILEKLTGTEIYAKIGKKIYDNYKEAVADYDLIDAEIKGANLLTEAIRAEYTSKIDELTKAITESEVKFETLNTQLNWLKQAKTLSDQLKEKEAAKQSAIEKVKSEENINNSQLVKQWDDTAEIRRLLRDKDEKLKHIESLNARLQSLSDKRWHSILDGIKWLETEHNIKSTKLEELRVSIAEHEPFSDIYRNAQRIEEISKSVSKALKDRDRHNEETKNLKAKAEESKKTENPLTVKQSKAVGEFETKANEVKQNEADMKAYDIAKISSELNDIINQLSEIQKAINAVKEYHKCVRDNTAALDELKKAETAAADTEAKLNQDNNRLPEVKEQCARAEAYLQGQMELSDHIVSLRRRFAETNVCPLCGNTDAHMHSDEFIDKKVAEAQEAADRCRKKMDETTTLITTLNASLKVLKRDLKARQATAKATAAALENAVAQWQQVIQGDKSTYHSVSPDEYLDILEKRKVKAEETKGIITEKLSLANDKQAVLDRNRKLLDTLRGHKESAEKKLQEQKARTKELSDAAQRELEASQRSSKDANEYLDEIQSLISLSDVSLGESITLETLPKIVKQIVSNTEKYNNDKAALDTTQRACADLSNQITACKAATEHLCARFAADYSPKAKRANNIEAEIRAINTDVDTLDGSIAAERQAFNAIVSKADEWFKNNTITPEEVAKIAQTNERVISQYRDAEKAAKESLTKATNEIGVITAQISQHESSRPEIDAEATIESLTTAKASTDTARSEATAEKARYDALLKNDDSNNLKQEANKAKRDELRISRDRWETLNKCFGASDGSQFKRIAQSYVLRALLAKANYYISMLSHRYILDCEDGSLTINVIDANHGGSIRNVGLLSGGESFVVSLALALGLSAISKEKINVDTLFIDEGFGSLDKDILDTVIDTFDRLHNIGGRRIGIISHVQDLKDRIATQIRLVRTGPSSSKVEIHTL